MHFHVFLLASRIAKMVRTAVLRDIVCYSSPGDTQRFDVPGIFRLSSFAVAGVFLDRHFK
jgi:hypothetical protein